MVAEGLRIGAAPGPARYGRRTSALLTRTPCVRSVALSTREVRMDKINAGDTAWLLTSAALVMLMTPALGFFYGGLVRKKNVLATIMHSFFILCLISVQWVLWGYSLAFGPDVGGLGIIGGLDWL